MKSNFWEDKDEIFLFHGSKGGITGKISPYNSRLNCDFGQGFYMGTDIMQTKSLVAKQDVNYKPFLYAYKILISEIPKERILVLKDMDWLYAVLACRNSDETKKYNDLPIAKKWRECLKEYDVIVGAIADDSIVEAMKSFAENSLTDQGLEACLRKLNLGIQFVFRTEFACSKIVEEPIFKRELVKKEKVDAETYYSNMKYKARNVVKEYKKEYKGVGKTLSDIIEEQKQIGE